MLTLQVTSDTWLKQGILQASQTPDTGKFFVKAGVLLALRSHEAINDLNAQGDNDYHVLVNLETPLLGKYAWYAYQRHVSILDGDKLLFPAPEDDPGKNNRAIKLSTPYQGMVLTLPNGKTVHTDQPIITNGSFSWGEATHGGTRIPKTVAIVDNIMRLATELQRVRQEFDRPIRVTSWHRPEPFNSRVGGASRSQHLEGKAADIVIEGFKGRDIARRVLPWWKGGVGIYPGNRLYICHLDVGTKRHWGI